MVQKLFLVVALIVGVGVSKLDAQVQTNIPSVIPGAKAVVTERIKVHSASIEGNLEGGVSRPRCDRLSAAQLR